jgi:hypothetical protein
MKINILLSLKLQYLLRLTNGNCFAAFRRLGLQKNPVGASAFVGFSSATFLLLLEHFVFLYRNSKNVSYLVR